MIVIQTEKAKHDKEKKSNKQNKATTNNKETINNTMNLYSNITYSIVETLSHNAVRTANIRNVTLVASSIFKT